MSNIIRVYGTIQKFWSYVCTISWNRQASKMYHIINESNFFHKMIVCLFGIWWMRNNYPTVLCAINDRQIIVSRVHLPILSFKCFVFFFCATTGIEHFLCLWFSSRVSQKCHALSITTYITCWKHDYSVSCMILLELRYIYIYIYIQNTHKYKTEE